MAVVPASSAALSVVVPTYNERERLTDWSTHCLPAYAAAGVDGELVIVDDNSPDGTGRDRRRSRATVSRSPSSIGAGKMGLGTAVVAGFEAANAPVVGVIDADLSHPPDMPPRMLAVMQRTSADIVDREPLHSRRRHAQLAD